MGRTIRRRRLEHKTDYKARLALLKSRSPRLVVRKSNRYVVAQLVISDVAQDRVIATANSKELIEKGWSKDLAGSLKSLPAAYLTGMLLGNKIKSEYKKAIADLGMYRNVKKSRIYAVIRGFIDSGIELPCDESMLPSDEDLQKNEKTKSSFTKVKGGLN